MAAGESAGLDEQSIMSSAMGAGRLRGAARLCAGAHRAALRRASAAQRSRPARSAGGSGVRSCSSRDTRTRAQALGA